MHFRFCARGHDKAKDGGCYIRINHGRIVHVCAVCQREARNRFYARKQR